jgi:Bacterial Ig-like domain (group 2)
MSSTKHKLRLIGALAALATLALAVSCRGFFVNPTLTSITVGPSGQTLAPSGTLQMVATGTFNDGSTSNVSGKCLWTSSDTSVATIGLNDGKVIAAAVINNPPGVTTITATDGTATNTATVNVCPAVTNMTVTANPTSVPNGGQITFTVMATFAGNATPQNVTNEVTWNISNTQILSNISSGLGTTNTGFTGTSGISATLCGFTSPSITITAT